MKRPWCFKVYFSSRWGYR